MNPYRISLDKSWGGGFRLGQWARYVGPTKELHGRIGKVVNTRQGRIWVELAGAAGATFNLDTREDHLERVERDDIATEMARRGQA